MHSTFSNEDVSYWPPLASKSTFSSDFEKYGLFHQTWSNWCTKLVRIRFLLCGSFWRRREARLWNKGAYYIFNAFTYVMSTTYFSWALKVSLLFMNDCKPFRHAKVERNKRIHGNRYQALSAFSPLRRNGPCLPFQKMYCLCLVNILDALFCKENYTVAYVEIPPVLDRQ